MGHAAMMLHHDRHDPHLEGRRQYSKLETLSISVRNIGADGCNAIGLRDDLQYRADVRKPDGHFPWQVDAAMSSSAANALFVMRASACSRLKILRSK